MSAPRLLLVAAFVAVAAASAGCAARTPLYRRERLVDPIMSLDVHAKLEMRKMKAFEAREGSTGGVGGAGGGCACK
ncbi:MAG: DUF4266 domain-containing protein [Candidatus Eisenbacteria bacterium]